MYGMQMARMMRLLESRPTATSTPSTIAKTIEMADRRSVTTSPCRIQRRYCQRSRAKISHERPLKNFTRTGPA